MPNTGTLTGLHDSFERFLRIEQIATEQEDNENIKDIKSFNLTGRSGKGT